MKLPHRFPIVEITWADAAARHASFEPDKVKDEVKLSQWKSVGYLVYRDDEKTVLFSDADLDADPELNEGVRGSNTIPSGWITATKYLRGGPRKPRKEPTK